MNTVEVKGITKSFGEKVALKDVSLSLPDSSIIGLIGLNGSGKTTLLRHLSGMYLPDQGQVDVMGCPVGKLGNDQFSKMGIVHQENRFLEWMTVEQQVRYVSGFYKNWESSLEYKLFQDFKLEKEAKVGTLSPGDVQKLAVLLAVCHQPELLILDEPASAMDPISRRKFLEVLFGLMGNHFKTVIVSSHVLTDIEKLVNRVICLHEGRIIVDDELDNVFERFEAWILTSPDGRLPENFHLDGLVFKQGNSHQAELIFDLEKGRGMAQLESPGYNKKRDNLNLERIFPLLIGE